MADMSTDPFTLGVASGDPAHDGFVIWTRLAVVPLADDGLGGMPDRLIEVEWQVAEDDRFASIAATGTFDAVPASAHSVHVELDGLRPGREYFYRFRVGDHVSPAGRAVTAPRPHSMVRELSMVFASCANFEHGYFTAYRHLAQLRPDLILHLGDYQYEYRKDTYVSPDGNVRDHEGPETETLADYRRRHAQYKSDPDLQAAHAAAPWLAVWDDHELDNNWANLAHEKPEIPQPNFAQRRAAAFQAYYENLPLRSSSVPSGVDMQLYRRLSWGRLATFHMMDTRQYRDDQACGDGWKRCPDADDPRRSITGARQEEWLLDGFRRSRARWDLLGQQVFFSQRDRDTGPNKETSQDSWDGYTASRGRITRGWVDAGVRNPVVLTGDVHNHWAGEVKSDFDDPTGESIGVELVASSITTGGNGSDGDPADNPLIPNNPHLKFFNAQRGFVATRITPNELTADFLVVPTVAEPGSSIHSRATFVVADRDRTLHQTHDRPVEPRERRRMASWSVDRMLGVDPVN